MAVVVNPDTKIAECTWEQVLTLADFESAASGPNQYDLGQWFDPGECEDGLHLLNLDDTLEVVVYTDMPLIQRMAEKKDSDNEVGIAWTVVRGIAWFLGNLQIGYLSKPVSELRSAKGMLYMSQVHASMSKTLLKGGFTVGFPQWDGQSGTWFTFSTVVKTKMRNLGLACLIMPATSDRAKENRLALTQFDVLFHAALTDAIVGHNNSKVTRHDFVNQSLWGNGPYTGSSLWDNLTTTFDSARLADSRLTSVKDHTKKLRVLTNNKIHEDSHVPNEIISKLSLLPLMDNSIDEGSILERLTKICDQSDMISILNRTNTLSDLRKERIAVGNLSDESRMILPDYSRKDNKARRATGESGFPIGSGTDMSGERGNAKTDAAKIHKNPKKGNGKGPSDGNPKGESKQARVSTEVWKCLSKTDKDQLKLGNKTAMVEALEKFEKVKAGTDGNLGGKQEDNNGKRKGTNHAENNDPTKEGGGKRKSGAEKKKGKAKKARKARRAGKVKFDLDENHIIDTST